MGEDGDNKKAPDEGLGQPPSQLSRPSLSFLGPPAALAIFVILAALLLLAAREKEGETQLKRYAPPVASPAWSRPVSTEVLEKAQRSPEPPKGLAVRAHAGVELRIEAAEETWVSVAADDGGRVGMLLKPGDTRRWRALKGFTLTLGNAGGVRIFVDGEELPALGGSGEVRRNVDLPAGWREGYVP